MPVSNPSYFPDQRGNGSIIGITAGSKALGANNFLGGTNAGDNSDVDDLIIIGAHSGTAGITDNVNLKGTIIIGVGAAPNITVGPGNGFPLTLIGGNSLAQFANHIDSTVLVGSGIANGESAQDMTQLVLIGNDICPVGSLFPLFNKSVLIGTAINTGPTTADTSVTSGTVMIGSNLFNSSFANTYNECVIIGEGIELANDENQCPSNIAIGNSITIPAGANGESNIQIGAANTFIGSTGNRNVVVGAGTAFGGSSNVLIGAGATCPVLATDLTYGCVMIGRNAGNDIAGSSTLNHLLLIESQLSDSGAGATPHALVYGTFDTGSLVLGGSLQGTNRDIQGTNTVKLIEGAIGTAPPVGGGYFYVSGGALHWMGSGGTDTTVAPA